MGGVARAYVGMQCFWGESAFAKLVGVVGTRVGYAGGEAPAPSYRDIQDHTEVIEVAFDTSVLSYPDIIQFFWSHHDPTEFRKKQYKSAILWTDEAQKEVAEKSLEEQKVKYSRPLETFVMKLDKFHQAEDYHQKYWLRSRKDVFSELGLTDQETATSELAAKLNAFMAGYQNWQELERVTLKFNLSSQLTQRIKDIALSGGDPRSCH